MTIEYVKSDDGTKLITKEVTPGPVEKVLAEQTPDEVTALKQGHLNSISFHQTQIAKLDDKLTAIVALGIPTKPDVVVVPDPVVTP